MLENTKKKKKHTHKVTRKVINKMMAKKVFKLKNNHIKPTKKDVLTLSIISFCAIVLVKLTHR